MHIRNPYRTPPDFSQLAEFYPLLKPLYIKTAKLEAGSYAHTSVYINKHGTPSINFKNPAAQRYLTEALLRRDFNLRVEIPPDRLCPAVPNRLNYVLWIQDIMAACPPPITRKGAAIGIDIGTGASVIYPLLACSLSPQWTFLATDVDSQSLVAAERNIGFNSLQNRIVLVQVDPSGPILQNLFEEQKISECDFVMCNPPFYSSKEEIAHATEDKEFDPSAVCTGADVEMITTGGELGFVQRMVQESVALGTRCRWYTSLLGKHASVSLIVELFRSLKVSNYGLTEFIQGQTRRWGIVWSFGEDRLPDTLVRETSESLHSLLPLPNNLQQRVTPSRDVSLSEIVRLFEALCKELNGVGFSVISPTISLKEAVAKVWASENSWSRKERRRLERLRKEQTAVALDPGFILSFPAEAETRVVLLVRFRCGERVQESGILSYALEASWVRGADRELFETLWRHLTRKILDQLAV